MLIDGRERPGQAGGVEALNVAEADATIERLSAAIRTLTAAGDRRGAAVACAQLGDVFANAVGNLTAARAWYVRATRLIEDEPPCIEQGWVAVMALGCDVDDPAELHARAQFALDRAREFGDVNLEAKALADLGVAQVQAGRREEGMVLLDEAMALVCGPADDIEATGKSVCSFLTACYFAADFDRAGAWAATLRRQGLVGGAPGVPAFLRSHCDSVQATALCELGRWGEGEAMLNRAIEEFESRMEMPSWHPAISLAELRIRQGRFAEAEMLLLGKDGHFQAVLPGARLHLARGDYDLARATAARGLRAIGDDRLRAAELLAALVDTELGVGDIDAATAAGDDLLARGAGLEVPGVQARTAAVRARVLAVSGISPPPSAPWRRPSIGSRPRACPCFVPRCSSTSSAFTSGRATGPRPRSRPGGRRGSSPRSTSPSHPTTSPSCSASVVPRRRRPSPPPGGRRSCGGRNAAG